MSQPLPAPEFGPVVVGVGQSEVHNAAVAEEPAEHSAAAAAERAVVRTAATAAVGEQVAAHTAAEAAAAAETAERIAAGDWAVAAAAAAAGTPPIAAAVRNMPHSRIQAQCKLLAAEPEHTVVVAGAVAAVARTAEPVAAGWRIAATAGPSRPAMLAPADGIPAAAAVQQRSEPGACTTSSSRRRGRSG